MMTSKEIRSTFLNFFEERGHRIVPSSSLVPHDDPSLLFTNAGMVQFKRVFTGEEKRDYKRATTSQKCVRAGGKHNDLENVGYTHRHHTFFEMLGNFSFGDYFKHDAIKFAWELLTEVFSLPKDKLWVSIYKDDDEAYEIWTKVVGFPGERIVRLGEKDNFWSMGDTGPCGPCSEILIDQGPEIGCGRPECKVGCDCDRYLELWNLVFMQFNRDETGKMTPLPRPSIDTGMGLERMCAILQGKNSNFETDLFMPLIEHIERVSGKSYREDEKWNISFRVIADHARALAFLIADGVLPSNEGRGYVVRRILRRAERHGRILGFNAPFLNDVINVVIDTMGDIYPELKEAIPLISQIVPAEEERFSETLEFGLNLLQNEVSKLKKEERDTISGDFLFKLYDTYGFPIDIAQDMAKDEGLYLDMEGFKNALQERRELSRRFWKGTTSLSINKALIDVLKEKEFPPTKFLGYEQLEAKGEILLLISGEKEVREVNEGKGEDTLVYVIVDQTPFYAESGGQIGDKGWMISLDGNEIEVIDTQKLPGDIFLHKAKIKKGAFKVGERILLRVDKKRRKDIASNHTSTHLLHKALRTFLGEHVKQSGSLVAPDRLRFDFTHFNSLTEKEIHNIEELVNEKIREDIEVITEVLPFKEAIKSGAVALFEEKYSDDVRVVKIDEFSKELCGGTHLSRTGEAGFFKIVSQSSVAAGIRRIEAVTGLHALKYVWKKEEQIKRVSEILKASGTDISLKVERLLDRLKELEKEVESLKGSKAKEGLSDLERYLRHIDGISVASLKVDADNPRILRDLADKVKQRIKSGVVVLGATHKRKVHLVSVVTSDLTDKLHAGELIKKVAEIVGGGGGGRPDMGQAGGSMPENLDKALESVYEIVRIEIGKES